MVAWWTMKGGGEGCLYTTTNRTGICEHICTSVYSYADLGTDFPGFTVYVILCLYMMAVPSEWNYYRPIIPTGHQFSYDSIIISLYPALTDSTSVDIILDDIIRMSKVLFLEDRSFMQQSFTNSNLLSLLWNMLFIETCLRFWSYAPKTGLHYELGRLPIIVFIHRRLFRPAQQEYISSYNHGGVQWKQLPR